MKHINIIFTLLLICSATTLHGQLYINEVMPSNDNIIADSAGEYDDWFEVYNSSNAAINLAGYYFTDDLANTTKWQVPSTNATKTTIPANGYKIFWADENETQGEDHTNFKLSDAGDLVYLYKPNGTTIEDGLTFPALATDQSYGRNTDGNSLLVSFAQSTPGVANSNGIPLAATPVISPGSGVYSSNQNISISSNTPGVDIYYTTNGSEPNQNSTYYNGPFSIGSSVSVRAIAIKSGYTNSEIATESLIYYNTDLPIISISTKPANLWNNNSGIYVLGTNGTGGNCMPEPANFNQDWERPANIIMLETDGSQAFNTNAGISISGGCSRRNPQRSLNVAAKSIYGASNFKHQIFPEYEQDKFKRFKLRNGGNDFNGFALRDVIAQSVVEGEVDIDQQRSRACVVFINGDYWGIMNIRDSFSEHWIKENHKIADKDSIDLLAPSGSGNSARILEGSSNDYINLYNYINANSLSNQSNYNYVQSKIDINEYINYWIVQLYMANTDWPGNNVKIWKEQLSNSKFRWLLYDTDWTLGYTRDWANQTTQADPTKNMFNFATNTANSGWPNDQASTLIFRKLLQNTEFKNEFIQRLATQMEIVFDANRCQAIADLRYNEIITEKQAHFNRWINETEDGTGNTMYHLNITNWQNEYDYVQNWFSERGSYMENHIKSHFSLGGTYTLNIPVNANTNGSVLLNENEYKAPYNYSGKYFDNVPMRIRAIAAPGYRFSHWQENGSTDAVQVITVSSGRTRTPVFEPAKELVINEIFYNPSGASESTEFIEIYNPDSKAKSLEGYYFDDGICFEFPEGATVASGEYIVVAKYASVYAGNGYQVFQWKDSALSNDGELLVLMNPAKEVIDSVRYNDNIDWPQEADGDGYSLALLSDAMDNYLSNSWQRQNSNNKLTPGAANTFCSPIASNLITANVSCNGNGDGFISTTASGGTAPYSYLWNTGQTSSSVSNLPAGNYTLTITDALQCEQIETISITQPAILAINATASNESYYQANDGSASALQSGGIEPYTYNWSNGSTSSNINNLPPGTYTVTVTDANGCTESGSVIINEIVCTGLNLSVTATNETTYQANDGTANAIPSGGTSPYVYSWSNGASTAAINNLSAGSYTINVIDAKGCPATKTATINAINCSTISLNITETNETMFQANDGTANATATGGTSPYTYSWSNGASTAVINNLAPGNYTLNVTDANACPATKTVTVNAIDCSALSLNITKNSETMFQANDGTANATATGGTSPYAYSWSNGASTTTINNLSAGSYTVNVIDAKGCPISETVIIAAVDCSTFNLNITKTNETMYQSNDGTVNAITIGGTSPYTYSWSNSATTASINNLASGSYTVNATDSKGCPLSKTVNINAVNCNAFSLNTTTTDETYFEANNGVATAIPIGGTGPYVYSWSNNATTAVVNNLAPGNYTVYATDALACPATNNVIVNPLSCPNINVSLLQENESCAGEGDGLIHITTIQNGTLPYIINWSNGATGTTINNLQQGTYSLEITDDNGCKLNETYSITSPAPISSTQIITNPSTGISYDGSIDLTVSGGLAPYTFYWSTGAITEDISNLLAGNYWVYITNSSGCNITETGIQIYGDCLDSITQMNNPTITSGTTQVSKYIISNGKLNAGSVVSFKAGNYVELQNNFEVIQGSEFEAKIEGCE